MSQHVIEPEYLQQQLQSAIIYYCGLNKPLAKFVAKIVIIKLQQINGGAVVYVPANTSRARNQEINKEFNGHNHKALALKYRMSSRNIYRIVNK